jgi:hypothetical protein
MVRVLLLVLFGAGLIIGLCVGVNHAKEDGRSAEEGSKEAGVEGGA